MKNESNYIIKIEFDKKENKYIAWIPALNNIAAQGENEADAYKNVLKVQNDYLKFLKANSKPIPKSDLH